MTPAAEYVFVSTARFVGDGNSVFSPSPVAAARTLSPTFALNALGYDARAFSLFRDSPVPVEFANAKALVLADLDGGTATPYQSLMDGPSARVFYDVVALPAKGTASHDFCLQPGLVLTAASEHLARQLSGLVGRHVETIAEPFDGPRLSPRAPKAPRRSRALDWLARRAGLDIESWRLRLFWSGEEREFASIRAVYPDLVRLGRKVPLALHCMAPQDALENLSAELREEDPDALTLQLEAWSPQAAAQALAACDLVLLPDAGPASRSRLIAAIHAGRLGIARSSPYHGKLGAFAWVGEDLAEGIRWSTAHAGEVLARLTAGQRYLDEVHDPATVARAWVQLFLKDRR